MIRWLAVLAMMSSACVPDGAYAQDAVLQCQVGPNTDLSHGDNLNVVTCRSAVDRLGLLDVHIDHGGCDIALAVVDGRVVQWKSEQMQADQAAHAGAFGILDAGETIEVFVTNDCRLVEAGFDTTVSDMTFGFAEE